MARRDNSPGPGNYHSPSKQAGPKYTIGEKRNQKLASQTPGVGAYNPSDKMVKSKSQFAQIGGGAQRTDFVHRDHKGSAGPGQYDSPSRLGGPKYTIGTKSPQPTRNASPSPGQYNQDKAFVQPSSRKAFIATAGREDQVTSEMKQRAGPG